MTDYKIPLVSELVENTENGRHKFNVISFFAGGGGSSTGYRMAGGKVLLINEFIDEAVNTYRANWTSTKIIHKDIRLVTAGQVLLDAGIEKFELDILDGSPPCSAFSTVGTRDKGWGKVKKYSDKSQVNVEDLFFEYTRMIEGIMPKVFIAENVSGLAKGAAKGYLNEILRVMRDIGYHVECRLLNAKFLGVPQSRNRVIFVGVRNDIMKHEYMGFMHPKPHKKTISLECAFLGLEFTHQDSIDTDLKKYKVYELLKTLSHGEKHKIAFTLWKASMKLCSPCITATTGNIGARDVRHWDNRAFSVSEVKRIMSVPDDYILTGTYQQKVERLGRMVAPFMIREIAENILKIGILNENT